MNDILIKVKQTFLIYMLFTSAQYKNYRFDYVMSASPITASKTLVEITKEKNTLRQIVEDNVFNNMVTTFESAANEIALNTWFSGLLAAIDPLA